MAHSVLIQLSFDRNRSLAASLVQFQSAASLGIEQSLFLISAKALLIAIAGAILGVLLGSRWPSLQRGGIWIWLPSGLFFASGLVHGLLWPYAAGMPAWREYFDPNGPGELTCAVVTWPAFAMAGYSLGMYGACVRRKRKLAAERARQL